MLSPLPSSIIAITVLTAVTVFILITRQQEKPKKKSYDSKVLLKELLESFGLEIPVELEEPKETVISSAKRH
ncbi:hypothetical protein [Prochlorococcus sp. MIT 1341]|uniref:hypothetical protein n=1 Tax=Prochlorococcus sp. MIT 1341 TaxID=3096221 RepID=UPI002A765187|nr:hypothetical protein [Prochlorococcus sp. MIT 1341]